MSLLSRVGRRVAERIAARVARDDLFERPGERAPQPPLPPRQGPPPGRTTVAGPGCQPVGLDALVAALRGPGAGARVVNHWATWCEPCVAELPHLAAVHDALAGRVELIGVSWDAFEDDRPPRQVAEAVTRFSTEHGVRWPSLLVQAPPDDFFEALDVSWRRVPQTWLVDAGGRVVHTVQGVLDEVGARDLVERALSLSEST